MHYKKWQKKEKVYLHSNLNIFVILEMWIILFTISCL